MAKPKARLQVVVQDCYNEPFLVLSVREAITREIADFMDLVPAKEEALHLLMGCIETAAVIHNHRVNSKADKQAEVRRRAMPP